MQEMKLEALSPFSTIKEGDTNSLFRFRLLNRDDEPVDLTNKKITAVVGNVFGKIMEKEIEADLADPGVVQFRFEQNDWGGFFGSVGLEIHVQDLTSGTVSIFPSTDYYRFRVERSLDTSGKEYVTIALEEVRERLNVVETSLISTIKTVNGTAPDPSGNVELDLSISADTTGLATKVEMTSHTDNVDIHITTQDKIRWDGKSNFSGNYVDLLNKPIIPANTSQLTNDSGFITSAELPPGTDTTELENRVSGAEATLTTHDTRITTLENTPAGTFDDTAIQSDISALQTGKSDITHTHSDLETRITAIETAPVDTYDDTALKTDIAALQNGKSDVTHTHAEYQPVGNYAPVDHTHPELHTHLNQTVIDDLSDVEGKLTYKGSEIGGGGGASHEHSNIEALEQINKVDNKLKSLEEGTANIVQPIAANAGTNGYIATTSKSFSSTYYAFKAFDGNLGGTHWKPGATDTTGWLQVELPTPAISTKLRIYSQLGNDTLFHIREFKVLGSVDGVNFDELGHFSGVIWEATTWQEFNIKAGEYKFYKIDVINGDPGFRIYEAEFIEGIYKEISLEGHNHPEYEHKNITILNKLSEDNNGDLTIEKSGNIDLKSLISNVYSSTSTSYTPERAFDGNYLNYWSPSGTNPASVGITLDKQRVVSKYRIWQELASGSTANPKSWNFEASNDNWATVDVLDTIVNYEWNDTTKTWNEFILENRTPYLDYRIQITEQNGGFPRIYDIEFDELIIDTFEHKKNINERSFVNVGLTTDLPVTVLNTGVNVKFDNIIDDHLGEYNPATGEFTAKEDGIYQINISLSYNSFAENGRSRIYMFRNNTTYKKMVDNFILAYMPFGSVASPIEKLRAGDVIRFAYNIQRETTLLSEAIQTYLTITKID